MEILVKLLLESLRKIEIWSHCKSTDSHKLQLYMYDVWCILNKRIKCTVILKFVNYQGCHWSGKSQGNSRSGKSQGILEFVREIWNFVESQGNSRKVRDIQENLYFIRGCGDQLAYPKIFHALHSKFAFIHKDLLFETYTGHVQNDYKDISLYESVNILIFVCLIGQGKMQISQGKVREF